MALAGVASGYDGPIPQGVGYGEVDVKDGWSYVCRGGAHDGPAPGLPVTVGGFVVVDVSKPLEPRNAGAHDGVGCSDIKVNDANDLVFYGTQRNPPAELATNDADPLAKLPRGVHVVDVSDKASPREVRFVPIAPNGVHTLHYVHTGSQELLFVQSYDWLPDAGLGTGLSTGLNNPATQRIQVFEVVQAPDGDAALALASVFSLPEPAPPGTNYFPHDITVQRHPLTGQLLGYVAYWDHGLVILNLDDITMPRVVGRIADTSPSKYVDIHQARPFPQLIAGRHVTVLEPELGTADESGQFTLVDTTDPQNPKRLGYWELPGDLVIPGGFLFSPHNFNLANGRIYLAHNHAGVWVVDASTEERLLQPQAVGYYQAHTWEREGGPKCQSRIWSAFYVDGYTYATDSCSGLNVLQFEGDKGLEGKGPARVHPSE
jgi:hypothetical protein